MKCIKIFSKMLMNIEHVNEDHNAMQTMNTQMSMVIRT